MRIGTPLNRDMDPAEVRIAASAELTDAGIAGLRGALDLSEGRFSLKLDREGADLAGEAVVNQVPLAIEWRENFADEAPFERRFHLQGTLSADAAQQLGLELPVPARGSFGLDATVLEIGRWPRGRAGARSRGRSRSTRRRSAGASPRAKPAGSRAAI